MKLDNYLPQIVKLDKKCQFKIKVRRNILKKVWSTLKNKDSAEKLKKRIITKYKLGITTKSFENYLRKNIFPLRFAEVFIEEAKNEKLWDEIFREMTEVCYRSSRGGKTSFVKLPKTVSKELAYFAGALRDGNLNLNIGRVFIVQKTSKRWLKEVIKPLFKKLFGVEVKLSEDRLILYSFPVVHFLNVVFQHPPGEQKKWETPKFIHKLSAKLKNFYIRGYFDAEGTSYFDRLRISISQSWHNKKEKCKSLLDLKDFLEENKITSIVSGPYYNNGTYSTVLDIFCKENPKNGILFFEKIGCSHPEKNISLEKIYFACRSRLADSHNPA